MTKESLLEGIRRLKAKVKKLPPFSEEIDYYTVKLDKLYDCYYLMLEQEMRYDNRRVSREN